MDEEYIRRSDVDKLLLRRIHQLESQVTHGKAIRNSIINLKTIKTEIDQLYSVKVRFKEEPAIWKKS